jgi:hypothetical protein
MPRPDVFKRIAGLGAVASVVAVPNRPQRGSAGGVGSSGSALPLKRVPHWLQIRILSRAVFSQPALK